MSVNFRKSSNQSVAVNRELTQMFPSILFTMHHGNTDWNNKKQVEKALKSAPSSYVLDLPEWSFLKETIEAELDLIMKEFFQNSSAKLRITQSWINTSDPETVASFHTHLNSIFSGNIYLRTGVGDTVDFIDNKKSSLITLAPEEIVRHPINKGDIVIFNSDQAHRLSLEAGKEKRVSISFNTFVEGLLGSKEDLTELRL